MIGGLTVALLFAIATPFLFYPIALFLRAQFSADPIQLADQTPSVDLIICAHNEEDSIAAKLENALGLSYPSDQISIWLASDGSTDDTVKIARQFEARGVRVLDLPRHGKAHAISTVADASNSEIMAFSDANTEWNREALRALVRPFADDRVGGVAGDQCYRDLEGDRSVESVGERSYWNYDRQLKIWQTRGGSAISATGAIYAIRRILFEHPPPDATDDFMISTGVIARGKRLVFAGDALAYEPTAEATKGEFRRKVRIITRGLRAVIYRRALLNPARTGVYAVELLLHKLWRRLTWIPFLTLLLLTPLFFEAGGLLAWLGSGLVFFVALGVAGATFPSLRRLKPFAIAAYILMVNTACAFATYHSLLGHRVSQWSPERQEPDIQRDPS